MLTLRRILFPTDYAPCADRAFAHASFLAAHHGAQLHVLHLTPVTGTSPGPPHAYHTPDTVERYDVTRRALDVAEAIVAYADEQAIDLIVMGTHGRRGVQRVAVGSTTEQVLRHADCPVLAVGLDAARATPLGVGRVLVPVDFSESSGPALAVADALAALYDARVDALHAAHLPDLPDVYGLGLQFEAGYPDVVDRSREALLALVTQHVDASRRGEAEVTVGPPAPIILDTAERLGTGLLVMPTHGRTGLERIAFGSVAEQVIRRAPCAVLALKSFGRMPLPDEVERPESQHLDDALTSA